MTDSFKRAFVCALAFIFLAGCSKSSEVPAEKTISGDEPAATEQVNDEGITPADITEVPPTEAGETEVTPTEEPDAPVIEEPYELKNINIVIDAHFDLGKEAKIEEFKTKWQEAVAEKIGQSVSLNVIVPDKNAGVEELAQLLDSGKPGDEGYPDAVVMSRSQLYYYQRAGYLWDMSQAYDEADFQSRLLPTDVNLDLRDEKGAQYGFTPVYGNGCITYVKASWFALYAKNTDGVNGIEDINTFDRYMDMLGYFSEGRNSGVISPGFINTEAPYIDVLPEFWQDAYPGFYMKDGEWVDGFTEEAAAKALDRIAAAYKDGIIDKDSQEADAKAAREKFFNVNPSISEMAFTYWAGEWARTLTDCMAKFGVDDDLEDERLLMLPAIKEITESRGGYMRREVPVWVIINDGDKSSARENAVFEALFETMLDGGDIQNLWMKSAKNVHWDNCIAPLPVEEEKRDLLMEKSRDFFLTNSAEAPLTAAIDMKDADNKKLVNGRSKLIEEVIAGKKSGEEAVEEYKKLYGETSDNILNILNSAP